MRKFGVIAVALLLVGSAHAADDKGGTKEESKEAAQAAGQDIKQGASQAQETVKEQVQKAEQAGQGTQHQARGEMKRDSFEIEGKVAKVSKSSVTLRRDEGPVAMLHVDKATKVEVDGNQASITQLKPGQEVKASFDLKGDKPIAGEIKADSKQ